MRDRKATASPAAPSAEDAAREVLQGEARKRIVQALARYLWEQEREDERVQGLRRIGS